LVNKEELLEYYRQMLLIRRFEEKAGQLYGMGLIAGFCHLYIGQEAVAVGVQSALKKFDKVITAYRDHGHMLVAGTNPNLVMAELMGRIGGCSKGKGGSMHMFDLDNGFYGGHGIVGAQVPLGTGIAFAIKYRKEDNIAVAYMGDGAVHQGQVFESFNMASLWKLPILYIVENNEYGMGTSVARHSCNTNLFEFSKPFNIPSKQIDGMDVLTVKDEAKQAVDYVRSGKGPMLIEFKTYRYRGHSMSDPGNYRTKDEVSTFKDKKDPILNLQSFLLEKSLVNEDYFKSIEKEIRDVVNESVEYSKNSPEPGADELYTDIYLEDK
jgi:pyruvate dehydrogenase E1 component alpha subunit